MPNAVAWSGSDDVDQRVAEPHESEDHRGADHDLA